MWGIIAGLVQGIVTGVVGPLAQAYEKRQDVTLEGFKAATGGDTSNYGAWLDYQIKSETLKQQGNQWWGPRFLYMVAGGIAVLHFVAVVLDSIPFWHHDVGSWRVPPLPGKYDTYEGWVIASLFFVSIAKGPLSGAKAWLDRR